MTSTIEHNYWLTTNWSLLKMYFEDTIDEAKYCGHLFGLGSSIYQNGTFGLSKIRLLLSVDHDWTFRQWVLWLLGGVPYETYMTPQSLVAVAQSVAASTHSYSAANLTSNTSNLLGSQNSASLANLNSQNGSSNGSIMDLSKLHTRPAIWLPWWFLDSFSILPGKK